jgi:glycosyltransferase involved in cell wall biosynthesis
MPYLSIVIPAYNEADRLPETLALVRDYLEQQTFDYEVVVVDDGSKDDTVARVEEMMHRFPGLRLIKNEHNKGKGAVVKQGMLAATGDHRLFMDADHSTPITEFDKFLPFIAKADIIIGSRYLEPGSIKVKQPFKRRVISRTGNWLIQHTMLPEVVDTQCGFKLFSARAAEEVFARQEMFGWAFDVELLTIAHQLGFSIKEIPVDWYDAKASKLRAAHAAWHSFRDLRIIHGRMRKGEYRQES